MTQQPGSWPYGPSAAPGPVPGAPFSADPGTAPVVPSAPVGVSLPPPEGRWRARHIDPVVGTEFGVAYIEIAPVVSGFAVGSLVAGIVAILVALAMFCFGLVGAGQGWGMWLACSFTILGGVAGGSGVGLGVGALRQVRRSQKPGGLRFTGRGVAIAGIACGGTGLTITLLALVLVVLVRLF